MKSTIRAEGNLYGNRTEQEGLPLYLSRFYSSGDSVPYFDIKLEKDYCCPTYVVRRYTKSQNDKPQKLRDSIANPSTLCGKYD